MPLGSLETHSLDGVATLFRYASSFSLANSRIRPILPDSYHRYGSPEIPHVLGVHSFSRAPASPASDACEIGRLKKDFH